MKYIINQLNLMINADHIISAKFYPSVACTDIGERHQDFPPYAILPPYMTRAKLEVVTTEKELEQDAGWEGKVNGVAATSRTHVFTGSLAEIFWNDLCRDGYAVTAPEEMSQEELTKRVMEKMEGLGLLNITYFPTFSHGYYEWLLQATKEEILAYKLELEEVEKKQEAEDNAKD